MLNTQRKVTFFTTSTGQFQDKEYKEKTVSYVVVKMGHPRPLFIYFRVFNSKPKYVHYKVLPMIGFEPRSSGIGSNRSDN